MKRHYRGRRVAAANYTLWRPGQTTAQGFKIVVCPQCGRRGAFERRWDLKYWRRWRPLRTLLVWHRFGFGRRNDVCALQPEEAAAIRKETGGAA